MDYTDVWQVGMEVAEQWSFRPTEIHKIAAVLKKHVRLENGSLFRRESGYRAGGSYDKSHIVPATQKLRDDAERSAIVGRLALIKWKDLDLDVLRKINGCLG